MEQNTSVEGNKITTVCLIKDIALFFTCYWQNKEIVFMNERKGLLDIRREYRFLETYTNNQQLVYRQTQEVSSEIRFQRE